MSQSVIAEAVRILLGHVPEGALTFIQEQVSRGVGLAHATSLWLRQG